MSDPRKHQRLGAYVSWEAMDSLDADEADMNLEVSLEHPGALSNLPHDDLEEEVAERERDEWDELSAEY